MMKLTILKGLVRDNLLHDKIFLKLGYRQTTSAQSFARSLTDGKPRGKSHDENVLEIIKEHLNLTSNELLNEIV